MLQPQQLRVLVAVRDAGSLTGAARALGYGVPTIVHHIAVLERQVQAPLVERSSRGTRLTPLGEALGQDAEQILRRVEQAERLVAAQRDAGLGTLRVGTFASMGSRLLPAAIRELRETTHVRVEVIEAEPIEVVAMLRAGDVHAGLVYDSAADPALASSDVTSTVLLEEPFQVLVANSGALADAPVLSVSDLADIDWVFARHEEEASNRVLRRICRSAGFEPRVLMRTDDLTMIHGLVAEGLGATLTTATAMDSRFAVVMRPTVEDLSRRRTSFIHLSGPRPPAVERFRDVVARRARNVLSTTSTQAMGGRG